MLEIPRKESNFNLVHSRLKQQCFEESILLNPLEALKMLNEAQKQDDPEAYEEGIVTQLRKKEEFIKQQQFENRRKDALFDFDDSVDCLSEISDQYKEINMFKEFKEQGEQIQPKQEPKIRPMTSVVNRTIRPTKTVMNRSNSVKRNQLHNNPCFLQNAYKINSPSFRMPTTTKPPKVPKQLAIKKITTNFEKLAEG